MQESIFIQYIPNRKNSFEESFLDLDFVFDFTPSHDIEPKLQEFEDVNYTAVFEPFEIISENHSIHSIVNNNETAESEEPTYPVFEESSQAKNNKDEVYIAKSKKTKNICFNICQKTIKVMKTRIYNQKLTEIAKKYQLTSDEVISSVLKIKNDFTGPKALQIYVESKNSINQVFKQFMKYFLQEKYLRHAINEGAMGDLKGYLAFKNQVVLNILDH